MDSYFGYYIYFYLFRPNTLSCGYCYSDIFVSLDIIVFITIMAIVNVIYQYYLRIYNYC